MLKDNYVALNSDTLHEFLFNFFFGHEITYISHENVKRKTFYTIAIQ